MHIRFKKGDAATLNFGSGAEDREAIVIDAKRGLSKIEWVYTDDLGRKRTVTDWVKNRFLTKKKIYNG